MAHLPQLILFVCVVIFQLKLIEVKLRKKELIERVTCTHDRRQVDVRITQNGLNLLKEADKEMNKSSRTA